MILKPETVIGWHREATDTIGLGNQNCAKGLKSQEQQFFISQIDF